MTVFTVIYYGTWYFVNGLKVRSRVYRSFSVPKRKSFRFEAKKVSFSPISHGRKTVKIWSERKLIWNKMKGKKLCKKNKKYCKIRTFVSFYYKGMSRTGGSQQEKKTPATAWVLRTAGTPPHQGRQQQQGRRQRLKLPEQQWCQHQQDPINSRIASNSRDASHSRYNNTAGATRRVETPGLAWNVNNRRTPATAETPSTV